MSWPQNLFGFEREGDNDFICHFEGGLLLFLNTTHDARLDTHGPGHHRGVGVVQGAEVDVVYEGDVVGRVPVLAVPHLGEGDAVLYCTVLYCTVLYCTVLYLGEGDTLHQQVDGGHHL